MQIPAIRQADPQAQIGRVQRISPVELKWVSENRKHPALTIRLDLAFGGGRVYVTGRAENENGNPDYERLEHRREGDVHPCELLNTGVFLVGKKQ
jgi:hypothetical protein